MPVTERMFASHGEEPRLTSLPLSGGGPVVEMEFRGACGIHNNVEDRKLSCR